jgi:predicted DCC family thiol-disulfide oxidoreductase YuxK
MASRADRRRGLTIWFDGECSFCRRWAYRVRRLLALRAVPLRECQSDSEILRQMREQRSWVLTDAGGESHYMSAALAVLLRHSPIPFYWPFGVWLRFPPVHFVADIVYRWIERNRGKLSRWL